MNPDEHWSLTFFDGAFWLFAEETYTAERTRTETDFVVSVTGAEPGWNCLDLGCGRGRHALALAARGLTVTGVDANADSLDRARRAASGLSADFVQADMRVIPIAERGYDLVLILQNTFGFFSDIENADLLRRSVRGLRRGRYLCIDVANYDYIRDHLTPRITVQGTDREHLIEQELDYASAVLTQRYTTEGEGAEARVSRQRLYGAAELASLFRMAGLEAVSVYGSFDPGRSPGPGDRYIQVVGRASAS